MMSEKVGVNNNHHSSKKGQVVVQDGDDEKEGELEIYFNNRPLESNLDHLRKEDDMNSEEIPWEPNEEDLVAAQKNGVAGGRISLPNHGSSNSNSASTAGVTSNPNSHNSGFMRSTSNYPASRKNQRQMMYQGSPMKGEVESPMRTEFQFTTKQSMKNFGTQQFLDSNAEQQTISPLSQVSPWANSNKKTSPGDSTAVPGFQNLELNFSGKPCSCYVNREGFLKPVSPLRSPCVCSYAEDYKAAQFLEQQKLKLMQSPIGGEPTPPMQSHLMLPTIDREMQSARGLSSQNQGQSQQQQQQQHQNQQFNSNARGIAGGNSSNNGGVGVAGGEKVKMFQFKQDLERVYEVENWKEYNKNTSKQHKKDSCSCSIF